MPDTRNPEQREREELYWAAVFKLSVKERDRVLNHRGPAEPHSIIWPVGPNRDRAVCQTPECGLILMYRTFAPPVIAPHRDHEHAVRAAYVPPTDRDDSRAHPWLLVEPWDCVGQDDTDRHSATPPSAPTGPAPAGPCPFPGCTETEGHLGSQWHDWPAPGKRPASISAAAVAKANDPEHRKTIASRSPEARRSERAKAKRLGRR